MNAIEVKLMINTILEMMVDPETGVVLSEEESLKVAEEWEGKKLEKAEAILKWVAGEKHKVESMTNYKRDLEKAIKTKSNLIDRLSNYAAYILDGQKWETPDGIAKISYRNNKGTVKIDDVAAIPDEYFKRPHTESNVSKTAIKEAIEAGVVVAGAHLEDTRSIIIK